MIEFIFTIDYEIYGNGAGSLRELVIDPTERLARIFSKRNNTFVVFAEAVEFQKMEEYQSDPCIGDLHKQMRTLRDGGFEIGLHLHPWWSNARYEGGVWHLDYGERNICGLPEQRVDEVVRNAVSYLRNALGDSNYTPVSFRGGLWLIQPTPVMARVLARHGVKVDSSVFKGGLIHDLGVDFRPSMANGHCWRFADDVNKPDPNGCLWELPIHCEMVPFWEMLRGKRLGLQKKVPVAGNGGPLPRRWRDFVRPRYPKKLDFCRMEFDELQAVVEGVICADKASPHVPKCIVAIGHSKDLVDFDTIDRFLSYLQRNSCVVTDFRNVLRRLRANEPLSPIGCG